MQLSHSQIDTDRFGIPIAKAMLDAGSQIEELIEGARALGSRMVITRSTASDLATLNDLLAHGALLTDTITTFSRDLTTSVPDASDPRIRLMSNEDVEPILDITRRCYAGYGSHYHADDRLDRDRCDEVYESWAARCCEQTDAADDVLVAEVDGAIVGFFSVRVRDRVGEGVLSGVHPDARARGLYHAFMEASMAWCRDNGATSMLVATQLWNYTVQRSWARHGFLPHECTYTTHLWLDS